jgi:hypothetical protein
MRWVGNFNINKKYRKEVKKKPEKKEYAYHIGTNMANENKERLINLINKKKIESENNQSKKEGKETEGDKKEKIYTLDELKELW